MGDQKNKPGMTDSHTPPPVESPVAVQRQQSFHRLFSLFTAAAIATFLICLVTGLANGIWQVTLVGLTTLGSLIFGIASQTFARQRRRVASEVMAILGFITAFAVPNLFWANATIYYLLGGSLIILISGVLLATRWRFRLVVLLIFFATTLIFSIVSVFPRYNIQESKAISFLLPTITALLFIGALLQFFRSLQVSTIRSRLLVAFILVAVIPLLISTIVSSIFSSQTAVDGTIDLLTAVSTLKEQSLVGWLGNLQELLHSEYQRDQAQRSMPRLLEAEPASQDFKFNHGNLSVRLNTTIATRREFNEIFIIGKDGKIIFSTVPSHEGVDLSREDMFTTGLYKPYYQLPFNRSEFEHTGVVVAEPIFAQSGKSLGVLAGFTNLEQINQIMQEGAGIGSTGETFLIDSNYTLLTPSIYPGYTPLQSEVISRGSVDAVVGKQSGSGVYNNHNSEVVVGVYRWLPDLNLALIAEQNRYEIYKPALSTLAINLAVSVFLVFGTILLAVAMTNSISRPISELTQTTQRIADGELELSAPVGKRNDEIAVLATSFNKMTNRLRNVIGGLEDLAKLRTRQLEARSDQIQAASRLGSAATSILDPEELIRRVVQMIQDQFDLYFVGLFLVDETAEYAVLQAGTGEAGQAMVERGHRIKVGQGMIGGCIQNGQPRVSQIAPGDDLRSTMPDLPDTHSEAAVPLRSRGQVLGAITLQSTDTSVFDESSLLIFQTLADQIAVAIDNARLFEETQNALEATRRAYGELSRQAWMERLSSRSMHLTRSREGLMYTDSAQPTGNGKPHGNNGDGEMPAGEVVELPIEVRGTVIGTLRAKKTGENPLWSQEEQALLATLGEQLGVALDSARLFEETLLRAERERLISEITNRVRETLDIDTVLKTAAQEMQKALDLEEVEVRMNTI